jgi:hypothetical protein
MAGRGSENKVPIVATVSLDDAGHPIHVTVAKVTTFSCAAIADWAQDSLARGCEVILADRQISGKTVMRHPIEGSAQALEADPFV